MPAATARPTRRPTPSRRRDVGEHAVLAQPEGADPGEGDAGPPAGAHRGPSSGDLVRHRLGIGGPAPALKAGPARRR
jgi:hypothetical protein